MEGFYKVPAKVWEELIESYREEITDNSQLTKAAKLAAEKNLWLASGYPPSIINAKIKPLSRELGHLTKRIRDEGDEEGEPIPPKTIKRMKTPKMKTPKAPKPSTRRRLLPTRPDETNPKPQKRKRQTEVEKLQPRPGWEEWGAGRKLRRQLEYDESPYGFNEEGPLMCRKL